MDKAQNLGFKWDSLDDACAKVSEELKEVKEASLENNENHLEEEVGDLLFSAVCVAATADADPVSALERANNKFCRRFDYVMQEMRKDGKELPSADIKKMEKLWQDAKKHGL